MSLRIDASVDELPYGNTRITSLSGMLSVLSWQPDLCWIREAGASKTAFPSWGSHRYAQVPANKKTVIPAGMPESNAMDGNLLVEQVLDLGNVPTRRFTSLWLDSGIPAGMTALQHLCITASAGAWVR